MVVAGEDEHPITLEAYEVVIAATCRTIHLEVVRCLFYDLHDQCVNDYESVVVHLGLLCLMTLRDDKAEAIR